jgi:hypothetical protein
MAQAKQIVNGVDCGGKMEPLIETGFSGLPDYLQNSSFIRSYFEKVLLCCYRKDRSEEIFILTNIRAIHISLKSRRGNSTKLDIQEIRFADVHKVAENKLRSLWSGKDITRVFLFNRRSQPMPRRGFAFPSDSELLPRFVAIIREQVSANLPPQSYSRPQADRVRQPEGLPQADGRGLKQMLWTGQVLDEHNFQTLREERLREIFSQERQN